MQTANPERFEAAVRAYLEPVRDQFNYEQMLLTFLSVDRFREWAQVIERYRSLQAARVLSSGCGFGGSLLAYRDAGAAQVVGTEVAPEYARFAALRVEHLSQADVVLYDGVRLPFRDAAFDVIESMDVIEHTTDPPAYLRELRRVLAPGGLILLVTPNRLWPVEQHLDILGPPWLPVRAGNLLFAGAARLPWVSDERAFRYSKLAHTRTQNMSLRRLLRLCRQTGLSVHVVRPDEHQGNWPLPVQHPALQRLTAHPLGAVVAPVRTLVLALRA